MKNLKPGHTVPIVCLDAGHYGKYNRSPVVPEYYESEMNWKLHNLLKAELEKYGIKVITTRLNQAVDLALVERGKASEDADLFISLHSNAANSEATKYVVAMYQVDDNCGEMDEQSKAFAAKLAKTVGEVMGLPYQTWSTKSSSDRDGNGYKDDYYGVLRGAHTVHTPGVIIEHGFHTNTATTKWLLVESNLKKLAVAEAKTIAEWFDVVKKPEEKPAAITFTLTLTELGQGAKGAQVKAMQQLLMANGIKLPKYGADSDFGAETKAGVIEYQRKMGLAADGIAGPNTWKNLLGIK
jgi:N-acetylmuramoyl-L-alanine amidase